MNTTKRIYLLKNIALTLKKALFGILLLTVAVPDTHALFRGGDIRWGCTPSGNFQFVMHLYRDCGSPNTFPDTLWLTTNATGYDSIGMVRVAVTDISPDCDCLSAGTPLNCSTATQYGTGAIEESIYTSDAFFPFGVNLTGVPPPTGWFFAYEDCCRAPTDNLAPGNDSFSLVTHIYPFLNTPVNTCFDTSPAFLLPPVLTGCAGDSLALFQVPFNLEFDSLRFELSAPMLDASTYITGYQSGYSVATPLPGPTHHQNNQAATFDPVTGDLLFVSYTPGTFALAISVTAYKCGVKTAEIQREAHVIITTCQQQYAAPLLNIQGASLHQGIMYLTDTMYADEYIALNVTAENTSGCGAATPHDVALYAFGSGFGLPMNTPGCISPPCAQLSPVIPQGSSLTDSSFVSTTFDWQTRASHLVNNIICGLNPTHHDFVFSASNKMCPVPSVSYGVLRIALKYKEPYPPIAINCISILPNGDVELQWSEVIDTIGSFFAYNLSCATDPNGPFVNLTSIQNITQTSYIHQGANAHLQTGYYLLKLQENFTGSLTPIPFDTVASPTIMVTTSTPQKCCSPYLEQHQK